jgi:hypothetical protein
MSKVFSTATPIGLESRMRVQPKFVQKPPSAPRGHFASARWTGWQRFLFSYCCNATSQFSCAMILPRRNVTRPLLSGTTTL